MFLLNTERVVITCETSSVRREDGYWQIALQQVCMGPGVLGECVSVYLHHCVFSLSMAPLQLSLLGSIAVF